MTKVGKYRNLTSLNYKGIIILYTLVLVSFIIFSAQIVRAEVLARETFDNPPTQTYWNTQLRNANQIQVRNENGNNYYRVQLEPASVELGRNFLAAHRDRVRVRFKFRWSPTMEHWYINRTQGGTHMFNAKSATFGSVEPWIRFDFSRPYDHGLGGIGLYAGIGQPCTGPNTTSNSNACHQERNWIFSNGQVPFTNGQWQELILDINCQDGWSKLHSQGNTYTRTFSAYERTACLGIGGIRRLSWNNYDDPTPPGGNPVNSYIDFDDWVIETLPNSPPPQQCADGTPYNQCSSNKPLYCLSNGTLIPSCGSPYICGCPANLPTCITQRGICAISENFPPTATITSPTQTTFIINTQINYNGQGSDPENQPLTYTWTYDIIGDTSPEFPLPPGQSGTFTPTILVRNQSTLYTLKLVVRDTQGATGTAMKNLTINPIQGNNCAIINAYWDRKSAIVGDLVRLIAEGSNCNGMYVNFTIYEDDTSSGDDQVYINPQLVSFANNRVEVTWVAEWQDDCGGLCNPPEYYFIVALRDNSNNRRQSATQLTVNRSLNQPPTAIINEPRMNSELISFETNYPTKAVIDYGLTSNYGNRDSDDILFRSTHSILLRGLIKGETYHYRITVTDSNDRSLSTNDRIFTFLSDQQDQQCADGTPYNQCSSTKPLYCLSNGTLIPSCGSPYICGCPANLPTCITQIGMCVISENFPPTATITLPTQTSFIINTQINYNGQGSDPENQPLTYTWTYDIIGDTSPEFPLPPGQSGTFTPTILVRNQSTLYTLKLVVRDTQGA